MSKISVIIRHEYLKRVRSKWFIVLTLLGPVGLAAMMLVPILAAALAGDGAEGKVAILDLSTSIGYEVVMSDTSTYEVAGDRSVQTLQQLVSDEQIQAFIVIPEDILDNGELTLYSRGGTGIAFERGIRKDFEKPIIKAQLHRLGSDTSAIKYVDQGVSVRSLRITDKGVEQDASTVAAVIGYGAGFSIYALIFIYGSMVMRGVIEEKTNRIVEVIASSVRPFEIMMGKIVGVGLVGLTQVVAWVALGAAVLFILSSVLQGTVDPAQLSAQADQMRQLQQVSEGSGATLMIGDLVVPAINPLAILLFLFYFLAGYFIYATLFAAVGSAVDQEADAQSLTLPITLPVIITIMFIGNVVAAPNSPLAVTLSLFPLFTPILMTVRIAATDVPWWQVLASVILTSATFFGAVWAAGRIYRIGILSYGKKPSLKQIVKWVR